MPALLEHVENVAQPQPCPSCWRSACYNTDPGIRANIARLCNGQHGSVIETGYILSLLQRLNTLRQSHRGAEPLDPYRLFRNRT